MLQDRLQNEAEEVRSDPETVSEGCPARNATNLPEKREGENTREGGTTREGETTRGGKITREGEIRSSEILLEYRGG